VGVIADTADYLVGHRDRLVNQLYSSQCGGTTVKTRTATRICRDPETRISFLVARWRPTQARCGAATAHTAYAAATAAAISQ